MSPALAVLAVLKVVGAVMAILLAFGGGAHVIDLGARKSIGWTSSQEWRAAALNGEDVDA